MRTYSPKPGEVTREWYVIDATDVVLGRLATHAATLLRGKHKPTFAPHVDGGDFVIIINAEKVALTGDKLEQKMDYRHSGYPGGLRGDVVHRPAREEPAPRRREGRQGHAPAQQAGPSGHQEAEGVRGLRSTRTPPSSRSRSRSRRSRSKRTRTDSRLERTPGVSETIAEITETDGHRRVRRGRTPPRRRPRRSPCAHREVDRRPGERHRPPQGGHRPRAPRPRHRPLDRQRPHPRGLLPQQGAPAARQRAVQDPELEGRYDVIARISGGGTTGQAGALRLGIARALNEIDDEAFRPALKKAGFLTRDARIKERKKYGLKKARKAPQYSQALSGTAGASPPPRHRTMPRGYAPGHRRVRTPRGARADEREQHCGSTVRHRRRTRGLPRMTRSLPASGGT